MDVGIGSVVVCRMTMQSSLSKIYTVFFSKNQIIKMNFLYWALLSVNFSTGALVFLAMEGNDMDATYPQSH